MAGVPSNCQETRKDLQPSSEAVLHRESRRTQEGVQQGIQRQEEEVLQRVVVVD